MSLRKLTTYTIVITVFGFGVAAMFFIGLLAAHGGQVTLDMTVYGERWVEYWVFLFIVAVVPYALYVLDEETA